MKRLTLTLALWLLCIVAFAQEAEQPKPPPVTGPEAVIDGPEEAAPGTLVVLDAEKSMGTGHRWLALYGPNPLSEDFYTIDSNGKKLYFAVPVKPDVVYVFVLSVAQADQSDLEHHTVQVGEPGPDPDPGPDPGPDPPPVKGLHVLAVYESLAKLSKGHAAIVMSRPVADYLDKHCVKIEDDPQWHFLDRDSDVSDLAEDWQETFKRTNGKTLPWLIIANEKAHAYEGKWPDGPDEMLSLLKKYGGE